VQSGLLDSIKNKKCKPLNRCCLAGYENKSDLFFHTNINQKQKMQAIESLLLSGI